MQDLPAFMAITGASIVASGIATLSGFGLGTIMTPLVLLFIPYGQTIFLIAVLHWFHDLWKIVLFKHGISWRLCLYFGAPSIVGSFLGALLLSQGFNTDHWNAFFTRGLGVVLIVYSFFLIVQPKVTFKETTNTTILAGLFSGFTAGLFGIRGAMKGAFLSVFDLEKEEYIATMAFISVLLDSTRLLTYFFGGIVLTTTVSYGLLLFIPATYVGSWIACYAVHRLSHEAFYKTIAFFLGGMGVYYLVVA